MSVHIGNFQMNEADENEFTFTSKTLILHPKYNSSDAFGYDLCLIHSQSISAEATKAACLFSAACLPIAPPTPGKQCWVAGYGFTKYPFDEMPDRLLEVGVNLMGRVKYTRNTIDVGYILKKI